MKKGSSLGRAQLVARASEHIARTGAPRLLLSSIMVLSACGAFVASFAALRLGLDSMMLRYPLAVMVGYVTFLLSLRGWIAWHRRGQSSAGSTVGDLVSSIDVGDLSLPSRVSAQPSLFVGGQSGGGGGGGSWAGLVSPSRTSGSGGSSGGSGLSVDLDEIWPVVVAIGCALGGLLAILYVVYTAPVLLAEVALDATIASALYGRLKKQEMSHWAMTVVRHTWLPALALVAFAALGGWALERAAPDARSLGGVIQALRQ